MRKITGDKVEEMAERSKNITERGKGGTEEDEGMKRRGEMPQQDEDDEMGGSSCPLLRCHCAGGGDGDYVTEAPPPARCTHPAVCKHTHIKRTLTMLS